MAGPIYVVVTSYGAPADMLREDGSRYPGLAMETDVDSATLEAAQHRAAKLETLYGPCRIARLVFEDHPAFAEGQA